MTADAQPTMPGAATPDMAPATKPGQSQARNLAGHYRWPEVTTTSNRQDTEPMNNVTGPEQSAVGMDATESVTEQQMRADFMHAYSLYSKDPDDYDPADSVEAAEYSNPWLGGDEKWMNEWCYLSDATQRWCDDSEFAAGLIVEGGGEGALTPIQARSEEQARYIAEHGIERSENGLLTSHYVTRVEERDAAQAAPSPLADFQPGNALAQHAATSERDGIER